MGRRFIGEEGTPERKKIVGKLGGLIDRENSPSKTRNKG